MTKRFIVSAVVVLVVIVVVIIGWQKLSGPTQVATTGTTTTPAKVITAADCPAAARSYETTFEAEQKASGKTITTFLAPQVHYNTKLQACLEVVGVAYKDGVGVSEDVSVVEVSSGHPILRWSNASKYFDDAGPANYVDPATQGIITDSASFQAKAGQYMSQ